MCSSLQDIIDFHNHNSILFNYFVAFNSAIFLRAQSDLEDGQAQFPCVGNRSVANILKRASVLPFESEASAKTCTILPMLHPGHAISVLGGVGWEASLGSGKAERGLEGRKIEWGGRGRPMGGLAQ